MSINNPKFSQILPKEYGEKFRVNTKVYTFLHWTYDEAICIDGKIQTSFYRDTILNPNKND